MTPISPPPSFMDPPANPSQENHKQIMIQAKSMMVNIVKKAIDQNRLNEVNEEGLTPLHLVVAMDAIDGVELLVKHKAKLNPQDPDGGETPLHIASRNNSQKILQILLEAGASVDRQNKKGCSPLYLAQTAGCAKLLIEHHANVNIKNFDGFTPLHLAVIQKNQPLVIILLENGADLHAKVGGFTPIDFSCSGPESITKILQSKSEQPF